jgi:NhaP-type Na+/H+ or K+/H+ antiporter
VPVALSMIGTRLRFDTLALMGWFGPRGLASVVFTLLAFLRFEEAGHPIDTLVAVAVWTILLSVVAHGVSAQPLAAWYARRLEAASGTPVELADMSELRQRRHILTAFHK